MTPTSHAMRVSIRSPLVFAVMLALWAVLRWAAYPAPNLWLPAHLCLVPLSLLAVRAESARRLAIGTYLAALAWWAVASFWLYDVARAGYIALAIYMALYPLAYVLLLRAIKHAMHVPMVIVVPIVWVAVEYVRGFLFTGLPWFGLGHSQPVTLLQVADLFGEYGVSFVVAMSAGLLCDLLTQPLVRPGGGIGKTVRLSLVTWLVVMGATVGYGRWRLAQAPGEDAPIIKVAVVQTDEPLEVKWKRETEKDNHSEQRRAEQLAEFNAAVELTRQAAAHDPDLIVWPETTVPRPINEAVITRTAVPSRLILESDTPIDPELMSTYRYWAAAADYYDRIHNLAIEVNTALLVGAHAYPQPAEHPEIRHNAAYLLAPDGRTLDRFDKVHRVPFGEYVLFEQTLPFMADLLRKLAPLPGYSLTPGDTIKPIVGRLTPDAEPLVIGTPICFEDVFGYVCRDMIYTGGRKRGHLLVNLTNDGYFPGRLEGPQHEQIARLRCIENRVPMARAVNRGVSALIDSSGRIVDRVEVDGKRQMVAGYAVAELRLDDRWTLFGRIGNGGAVFCLVVTLIAAILAGLGRRFRKASR